MRNPGKLFFVFLLFIASTATVLNCNKEVPQVRKINGYRGIWFSLGQITEYGDKYSGGLGTYTAKHHPLAVYAPEANKTFFVYGGTTEKNERHLLAMISFYDHNKHQVSKPVVVHDKQGVSDPHDNPSLSIDSDGYLWVFVSGREMVRPGYIYRSLKPYDIQGFERIKEDEFTYPQPWFCEEKGFVLLFTKYIDVGEVEWKKDRELFCMTSPDGINWSQPQKLVKGGHYQMSNHKDGRLITAFNSHPDDLNVDGRTNLYFLQSDDFGKTWKTIQGEKLALPLNSFENPALIREYQSEGKLVYIKDIGFDLKGNPVMLYITSNHFKPGPAGDPRMWTIAHWSGEKWLFKEVTTSTHNYDMGSIYFEEDGTWRIIAPTEPGPQYHGTGGEVAIWTSNDEGMTWEKKHDVTPKSKMNHTYVRRPVNAHPDFYGFWADGNPDSLSQSRIYFINKEGDKAWMLPYDMDEEFAEPELLKN